MATENILEGLSSGLSKDASVKNLFGEPVLANGKTIIPVASISYGFGGGFGQGKRKGRNGKAESETPADKQPAGEGEGSGGGGGLRAVAKGVFEITPGKTRYVPATPLKHLLIGFAAGFLVKSFLSVKRRR